MEDSRVYLIINSHFRLFKTIPTSKDTELSAIEETKQTEYNMQWQAWGWIFGFVEVKKELLKRNYREEREFSREKRFLFHKQS